MMKADILTVLTAAVLSSLASTGAVGQTVGGPYKVIVARSFELQDALNNASKEGWEPKLLTVSTECRYPSASSPQRSEKGECLVVVLERRGQ